MNISLDICTRFVYTLVYFLYHAIEKMLANTEMRHMHLDFLCV